MKRKLRILDRKTVKPIDSSIKESLFENEPHVVGFNVNKTLNSILGEK